jgi:hypothetical protein
MTRYTKTAKGYHINGKVYKLLEGSRVQVFNENAYKTSGQLTKSDLVRNKNGRIVSKKKYNDSKKNNNLLKHGYSAKKGKFGFVRVTPKNKTMRKRK